MTMPRICVGNVDVAGTFKRVVAELAKEHEKKHAHKEEGARLDVNRFALLSMAYQETINRVHMSIGGENARRVCREADEAWLLEGRVYRLVHPALHRATGGGFARINEAAEVLDRWVGKNTERFNALATVIELGPKDGWPLWEAIMLMACPEPSDERRA